MYIRFIKSQNKVVLLYVGLFLQSCSSVISSKSNINPITRQDLLGQPNGPLIQELNSKFDLLQQKGFIGGNDPRNDDIKKHLMFVFFHSLVHRQIGMPLEDRLNFFEDDARARNLVWRCRLESIGKGAQQRQVLEFKLRDLFEANNQPGNLTRARRGKAPRVQSINGGIERVDIDHLLKDNDVVIELPQTLHQQKTLFIDNLINPPEINIIRDAAGRWKRRFKLYRMGQNQ